MYCNILLDYKKFFMYSSDCMHYHCRVPALFLHRCFRMDGHGRSSSLFYAQEDLQQSKFPET